jgi:hypothetical protein
MVATIAMRVLLLLTLDNSEARYTLEFYPVVIVLGSAVLGRLRPSGAPSQTLLPFEGGESTVKSTAFEADSGYTPPQTM